MRIGIVGAGMIGGTLARLFTRAGHEVVATDLHANKLRKIESEAKRLGLSERLKAEAHDASQPWPQEWGEFHAFLVDAPCSGLGTLRRHPELVARVPCDGAGAFLIQ